VCKTFKTDQADKEYFIMLFKPLPHIHPFRNEKRFPPPFAGAAVPNPRMKRPGLSLAVVSGKKFSE
jgi:hypothetical protein